MTFLCKLTNLQPQPHTSPTFITSFIKPSLINKPTIPHSNHSRNRFGQQVAVPISWSFLKLFKLLNTKPAFLTLYSPSHRNHNKDFLPILILLPPDWPWCLHMALHGYAVLSVSQDLSIKNFFHQGSHCHVCVLSYLIKTNPGKWATLVAQW